MPLSSPRDIIKPLSGTYAALLANIADIQDREICYATDQDQYYQNESGVLVEVGATKAQGLLADSALQPGDNVSTLTNDICRAPVICQLILQMFKQTMSSNIMVRSSLTTLLLPQISQAIVLVIYLMLTPQPHHPL